MEASLKSENVQQVIKTIAGTPERVRKALATGLARALEDVVGRAGTTFMSGPSKTQLGVRTTRLRGALASEVVDAGDKIIGRVGDNMPYAAFHEFGFHGTIAVRAHTRVRGWLNAKGQALKTHQTVNQLGAYSLGKNGKPTAPVIGTYQRDIRPEAVRLGLSGFKGLSQVRAYARKINYAGRPFLKPALDATDIAGEINQELQTLKAA